MDKSKVPAACPLRIAALQMLAPGSDRCALRLALPGGHESFTSNSSVTIH